MSQAAIAAISGLIPTMFMTRVRFIDQNRERHLGRNLLKCFGKEVCRSHAGLHGAERMFDCLSTPTHGFASRRCCTASSKCLCFLRRYVRSSSPPPLVGTREGGPPSGSAKKALRIGAARIGAVRPA